jgi:hypothetical protein
MFKRKSTENSNKPVNSLMIQVAEYVASEGKVIDTVIGHDLEGKRYSVILTTSGDAAENEKRNTIASFANSKSNHHVPVGGMMLLSTVWLREPEAEGEPTTGIARWSEFFGNSREELLVGNAMYRAGVTADPSGKGKETKWAVVDRMSQVITLTPEKLPGAVAALADKCAADRARARPLIRLMNDAGEVLDYTSLRQDTVEVEIDGEKARRAQNGSQMAEAMTKNKRLVEMMAAAEKGEGTLEMIPVLSVEMSKKMMNSPRGNNFISLAKRFSDSEQVYANECYIRRAPTDDFNYISHFAVTNADRFDPLLVASARFEKPAYSAKLLAELGVQGSKPAPEQGPANDPSSQEPDHTYEDAPGFNG